MEVRFEPEIEKRLTQSAAQLGRAPDDLVQELVARHLEDERRYIEAVNRGEEALRRGDFLTHEQVGVRWNGF